MRETTSVLTVLAESRLPTVPPWIAPHNIPEAEPLPEGLPEGKLVWGTSRFGVLCLCVDFSPLPGSRHQSEDGDNGS